MVWVVHNDTISRENEDKCITMSCKLKIIITNDV